MIDGRISSKLRLISLLILGNSFFLISGFEIVSNTRRNRSWQMRSMTSQRRKSSLFGLHGSQGARDLREASPHQELEPSSCDTRPATLDSANHETSNETYELASPRSFLLPSILEYKEERDAPDDHPTNSVSAILESARALKDKYNSKDKIYALVVRKNLPKRKNTSIHSFVSSMSAMAALLVLLPTFHPGIDDLGLPRLFEYEYASHDLLWQSQLVALLQMVSSILGVFRLPKHSPNVRTGGFVVSALIVTQLSLLIMSSLNGTDVYLFDAFSIQGRILVSVVNTALLIGSLDSLALIVGDKEKKGWETVPNYRSRQEAFFAVFPFHILICITGNAALPVLCDKESFVQNALPFYGVYPGVQTLAYVAISLSIGLGALLATLQFEKKLSADTASFWNLAILTFFTFDGVKFVYLLVAFPEHFEPHTSDYFTTYTPHLQSLWHTNEVLTVGTVIALVIGIKNYSSRASALASKKSPKQETPLAPEMAVSAVTASKSPSYSSDKASKNDPIFQQTVDDPNTEAS